MYLLTGEQWRSVGANLLQVLGAVTPLACFVLAFVVFGWIGIVAMAIVILLLVIAALVLTLRSRAAADERPTGLDGKSTKVSSSDQAAPTAIGTLEPDTPEEQDGKPGPPQESVTGDKSSWISEAWEAAEAKDPAGVTKAFESQLAGASPGMKAIYLELLDRAGSASSLMQLQQLNFDEPDDELVARNYCSALSRHGEQHAAAQVLAAFRSRDGNPDRYGLIGDEVRAWRAAGDLDSALIAAFALDPLALPPVFGSELASERAQTLVEADRFAEAIYWFEYAIQLAPTNRTTRFSGASLCLNNGLPSLAVVHYSVLAQDPAKNPAAMNNLAVALQALRLPQQGVQAYKQAAAAGNARAHGNIAAILADVGMSQEAEEWLEKAEAIDDLDERVAAVRSGLATQVHDEVERRAQVSARGLDLQKIIRSWNLAAGRQESLAGRWAFDPGGDVTFSASSATSFEGERHGAEERIKITLTATGPLFRITWASSKDVFDHYGWIGLTSDGTLAGYMTKRGRDEKEPKVVRASRIATPVSE